jgi:hypothetical protein
MEAELIAYAAGWGLKPPYCRAFHRKEERRRREKRGK